MFDLSSSLDHIVSDFSHYIATQDTSNWNWKPRPSKWSRKEILGHLIDSALNNIQRFIRGTHEEGFKIVYQQDKWVVAQHYNEASLTELLDLWRLLNHQIVRIIRSYPANRIDVTSDIGLTTPEILNMREIANGYIEHLLHHLYQIRHYQE